MSAKQKEMGDTMDGQQQDELSAQEMEMAQSVGLQTHRKFGAKTFALYGVAEKENPQKCDALVAEGEKLRMQGQQVKMEEKSGCIAIYIRVE